MAGDVRPRDPLSIWLTVHLGGVNSLPPPPPPSTVLENPVYKVENLGGISWELMILNIRLLASLATIINKNKIVLSIVAC